MKTEMIQVPIRDPVYKDGETERRHTPSEPLEAFVAVEGGMWVHRTLDTEDSVVPRGNWTISVGPKKAFLIAHLPSKRIALRIGKALVGFPEVDWTQITKGEQLPLDFYQIVMILRNTLDWEGETKSLEELSEKRRKEVILRREVKQGESDNTV